MTKSPITVATMGVWTFSFVLALTTYTFYNDHFGRLSPARQIARYGELPFRDFFDPGFVLTDFASAAVQRLIGDNLLGEMLLTSAAIAAGTVCLLLLVHRLTDSMPLALVTAVAAAMASPRPYDYDKFLFYPLGLLVCWRYAETRNARHLAVAAAVAVVAGMFRYDNGMFIAASGLTVIAATHIRDRRLLLRRAALFAAACAALAIPYVVFLQMTGGVFAAIDQIADYALREGTNTRLSGPPDLLAGSTAFSWSVAGASAGVFYLFLALPLGAVVMCRADAGAAVPRVWSAAVMTLLVAVLILREPIAARIGGAIAPAAVLAAWSWRRSSRFRFARAVVAIAVVATLARATDWKTTILKVQHNAGSLGQILSDATTTPPSISLAGARALTGVIEYVRRCTTPGDRVFAAWFAPELYYLSGRGFAGGVVAIFGGHWAEPEQQLRIVAKMASELVSVVLVRDGDESFAQQYPIVGEYLRTHYEAAGSSAFGQLNGERFVVLTRTDRRTAGRDPATAMPCFAGRV